MSGNLNYALRHRSLRACYFTSALLAPQHEPSLGGPGESSMSPRSFRKGHRRHAFLQRRPNHSKWEAIWSGSRSWKDRASGAWGFERRASRITLFDRLGHKFAGWGVADPLGDAELARLPPEIVLQRVSERSQ
jgi:hypothetical protein